MKEAEAELTAYKAWVYVWIYMARCELMRTLDRLGYPCETWEKARETMLWLLKEVHDD